MALLGKIKRFFSEFRIKHKITINNPHNGLELWHIYLSPANITSAIFGLVIVIFISISLIIAFTPVMDFLPGYQGNKTRNALIENHLKLDLLENEIVKWKEYYYNIVRVMDGAPVLPTENVISDSLNTEVPYIERSIEDSILRKQIEGEGEHSLKINSEPEQGTNTPSYFSPVKGMLTTKFNPQNGEYGVTILTSSSEPVISILDGTVVTSLWTPTYGNVIYILHPGNIVSGYLFTSRVLKKTGERVNAGDVIAFTGNVTEENNAGYIQFQLWNNGNAVDPENYIIF